LIFVDTGAWYASEVEDDEHHSRARKFLKNELQTNKYGTLVTSDYVLDETLTLLRTRRGVKVALSFVSKVRKSQSLEIVWVGKDIFNKALEEQFSKFDDERQQDLSFTDCTSFSIMKELSITSAFAFDAQFERAGFTKLPS
jgi:uncharacterized protein